jgi:hypothetical protein
MSGRRLGMAAMACGLIVALGAQRLAPLAGPPLFDGVVVIQPYQWLSPPPGLQGGAKSAQQADPVTPGEGGGLAIGTPEQPSQIQVSVSYLDLALTTDTTSIKASIAPVPAPDVRPGNGIVAGNAYQVSLTDEHGTAISLRAGGTATLVMRAPASLANGTIEQFANGAWIQLSTASAGFPDTSYATATSLGLFVLVAPFAWTPSGETAGPPAETAVSTRPVGSSEPGAPAAPTNAPVPGVPWGTIAGEVVSLLVLVCSGFVLWRVGRKPAPSGEGDETGSPPGGSDSDQDRPGRRD